MTTAQTTCRVEARGGGAGSLGARRRRRTALSRCHQAGYGFRADPVGYGKKMCNFPYRTISTQIHSVVCALTIEGRYLKVVEISLRAKRAKSQSASRRWPFVWAAFRFEAVKLGLIYGAKCEMFARDPTLNLST
ncbi:hypothetical protein EVAR_87247_1 [Eumeta japonica]|uniref:Uncharacterized protein n=1 Tax=Eumeta variegata TaxID=151549 RepID=A0A4C1YP17_EUMVA|nr:hypothetical protein EVAR_87247_1 [Eumeta japonica]